MNRKIELLAPGGDIDSIKAAIAAGTDAIYCGLNNFNARNRAVNIDFNDLQGILNLAHRNHCKVYLTLNILIIESEFRALVSLLNKLVNTSIDGIIVQDLGLLYLVNKYFKSIDVHASTQLTTHNAGQIEFLKKLNVSQVNLCRELSLTEIAELTPVAQKNGIKTEVFVHGSYCIGFSGSCYMSSVLEAKSGNRGRCSQPCRDQYLTTPQGNDFPLNLKDNSAYFDLAEIAETGVDSIKIEGRIKKFHYVYTVVAGWREQLDKLYQGRKLSDTYGAIQKVFNRDFSNGFLKGKIDSGMYIDNPRDNSARHFSTVNGCADAAGIEKTKQELHALRTGIIADVKEKISHLSVERQPLALRISGDQGTVLRVEVQIADGCFTESTLATLIAAKGTVKSLDYQLLCKRFKNLDDTEYRLEQLELTDLAAGLYIPASELTALKTRMILALNDGREAVEPVVVPRLRKKDRAGIKPALLVLISSAEQIADCENRSATICFQLPACFNQDYSELVTIFQSNRELIPWFPAVLIGKDYLAALDILQQIRPELIVTNNTGIAFEAASMGIKWIAGPYLNTVNSFSLLCLKGQLNCAGAFISNEISRKQIKDIVCPDDFNLYYSLYHPVSLLTSRQCLFRQIIGCEKAMLDDVCLLHCAKSAPLANLKNGSFLVTKAKGEYHTIYNRDYFLNTDIVSDFPDMFSGFLLDLREIDPEAEIMLDRCAIIRHFEQRLNGDPQSEAELRQLLNSGQNNQYNNGI